MHAIKRQARRNAWDNESFNPFGRRRRHGATDVETHAPSSRPLEAGPSAAPNTWPIPAAGHAPTEDAHPGRHDEQGGRNSWDINVPEQIGPLDGLSRVDNEIKHNHNTTEIPIGFPSDLPGEHTNCARTTPSIPMGRQLQVLFSGSSFRFALSFLFGLVPAGFALYYCHAKPLAIFFVNFFAILPSGSVQGFAAEELGAILRKRLRPSMGDTVQALINQTFNNGVQLITSILLLRARQIDILRTALLGAILINMLFMTGLSFLIGGIGLIEQFFNAALAQTIGMLLLLAVLSVVIPTAAHSLTKTSPRGLLEQSRGTAIIIMFSYGLWLYFSLRSNRLLFDDPQAPVKKARKMPNSEREKGEVNRAIALSGAYATTPVPYAQLRGMDQFVVVVDDEEDDDGSEPLLSPVVAVVALVVSTTLIAFNTEFATSSISGLLTDAGLSKTFIGLVIVPVLSIDPLCVRVAQMDKLDLSIALTLERCMQTALMVIPFIVLLGWCMGIDEMTMEFDTFPVLALFASIIIVTYVVQEGKSNWLTGALLIKVYLLIALSAYYVQ